jgi:hypothetical protein
MVRFARGTVPRGLLHEVFAEVLEDFAFAEGIREGSQTELVERDEVFEVLEGRAKTSSWRHFTRDLRETYPMARTGHVLKSHISVSDTLFSVII